MPPVAEMTARLPYNVLFSADNLHSTVEAPSRTSERRIASQPALQRGDDDPVVAACGDGDGAALALRALATLRVVNLVVEQVPIAVFGEPVRCLCSARNHLSRDASGA